MKKRWLVLNLIACIGIGLLILGPTEGLCAEEEKGRGVIIPAGIKEADIDLKMPAGSEENKEAELVERPVFISVPDIFEDLERAPVKFYHDKHTLALQPDGCEVCHPKDKENKFLFTYPKQRDESDEEALMNSFHDGCIGCHDERHDAGQKTGPVTCGECHAIEEDYHKKEYLPIMPEYYEVLRDTYHRDCLACHQDPAKAVEDAGGLDWKNFYVKEQQKMEIEWPQVNFDYYLHDKHDKALEEKCELCHYISPEAEKKLTAEGKEPACKDWLMEIPADQSLTEEAFAHPRCINCHLERKDAQKDSGPVYCKECHTGILRTAEEMKDVPRSECEQEEKILIQLKEDVRMKGVAFDHKSHQANTRSCQDCHHDTLQACNVCHTVNGTAEGDLITLAEAYHEVASPWSCIGCHETEKKKPDCAGCHHLLQSGLVDSACATCHSGSLESLDNSTKIGSPEKLFPDDLKQDMEITILENEYQLSKLPHDKIVKKLTHISNSSRLARYFHTDETTICAGCHHISPLEAKTSLPLCSTCHTLRKEPQKSTPTLLGAYHQQCLGCHKQMGGTEEKMPRDCAGCHEEKPDQEGIR
jgi:hypothetical protein